MKNFRIFGLLLVCMLIGNFSLMAAVSVSGEMKKWHKVTLDVVGVQASEKGSPNPFLDYKLTGVFTQGNLSFSVPGYFAADGNAAETGADEGNVWRIHFTPPTTGEWNYQVRFRRGNGIAIGDNITAGSAVSGQDNVTGSFTVGETDKTGRDFRAKGRLQYVNKHHLQFSETGEWFLKAGSDSPENFLAYNDFDNTSNSGGRRKSWSSHVKDWNPGDPQWKGSKGRGIIGAVNYLAAKGMNVFSFLTMNIRGDDDNVYPYVNKNNYLQFDCSKLDQWEILFDHGQKLGMYLHFKTQETENEMLLDNGAVGTERKLYYRELIARYGHHLALNWNLGEENGDYGSTNQNDNQRRQMAQYFRDHDPYQNHVVIHTAPGAYDKIYTPLLGDKSELTGASLQLHWNNVHNETKEWIEKSANAGKPWVVANDEQGGADTGVPEDAYNGNPNKHDIRKQTLWGNLMAGGAGVEYYFGYKRPCDDLVCQDLRSRNDSWEFAAHALRFFNEYVPFWDMKNADGIVSANNSYGLSKEGDIYVVYLRNGGSTTVDLAAGSYNVKWYNPRTGGGLVNGSITSVSGGNNVSIGSSPSSNDWVALITNVDFSHPGNGGPRVEVTGINVSPSTAEFEAQTTTRLRASVLPSNASNQTVIWSTSNSSVATVNSLGVVKGISAGTAIITATTNYGGFSATSTVTITPSTGVLVDLNAVQDAYLEGGTRYNTEDLRIESGRRVSYLKFDLSNLPGTVTSVDLKLTVSNDSGDGKIDVTKGSSNNWNEDNLSASNAPSAGVELGSLNESYGVGQTYTWSLDASAIQTGGMLTLIVSQVSGGDVSFASDENSNGKPVLTIKTSTETTPDPDPDPSGQSPYLGTAAAIPGMIEAENFDMGGEGIAYHDMDEANQGGEYRTDEGVDLEVRDSGVNVGWTAAGEWLEYTVNASAGTYNLKARLASTASGKSIDVMIGSSKIATIDVPNTGDWGVFETVTVSDIVIPGGSNQILKVEFVGGDANFNWIEFEQVEMDSEPLDQSPYLGTAATIPGTIEAENFDIGGEGFAYHDTDESNQGGEYRADEGVDLEARDGGISLGWTAAGEWVEYIVNATAGTYDLQARLASVASGKTISVMLGDNEIATVNVPNTGDWGTFQTVTVKDVVIPGGSNQILRVEFVDGDANINWIKFMEGDGSGPSEPGEPGETLVLTSISDFPTYTGISGFSPAYKDNGNNCLAIDASQHKDKYAAARVTFSGASGTYDLTLNTLTEIDGESSYKVRINGVLVGEFQNPETEVDYSAAAMTWEGVEINNGDVIQVEFNSHSNGKIPEDGAFAFSRGRWTNVTLTPVSTTTPEPPTGEVSGAFIESNGYLVIDAESADISGTVWSKHTTGGNNPWGNGYIQYNGGDRFQADKIKEDGTLKYDIRINTPGVYQFIWRTGYGFNSQSFDGANDTWLKVNGSEFYGLSGSRKVDCTGEFMKLWVQKNAFVNECFGEHHGTNGMSVWAEFDAAGDYSIEISGRSKGHVIDRLFLFQAGTENMAMNENTPESPRTGSARVAKSAAPSASVNVYPNSFESDLNISLSDDHSFEKAQLIDINGTPILSKDIAGESKVQIHTSVKEGVYFLRVSGANGSKIIRVIKK